MKELVIVPCSAVFIGTKRKHIRNKEYWVGKHSGDNTYFLKHIKDAINYAKYTDSLLIFSGGQTEEGAGPVSEAIGYLRIATLQNWINKDLVHRVLLDEFSRNTFENLYGSICRYKQFTEKYPDYVTVFYWAFMSERFYLHAEELRTTILYNGVNNPPGSLSDKTSPLGRIYVGERANVELFSQHRMGDGGILGYKLSCKDPFKRGFPY